MEHEQKTLAQWLPDGCSGYEDQLNKLLSKKVIKEFSVSSFRELPWASWREFGTHKNVLHWVLLETGHAVGWNENGSRGWSFPVKKLTPEQFEKYKKHTLTYEQYYEQK
jgi:hypothetical protein